MNKLYEKYIKTDSLPTLFCPGCGNGIIQFAAINAIDKLGIKDDIACVSGIGCSSWIPCYYKLDVMHTMHGRALAFAGGLKLARPDKKILVFKYKAKSNYRKRQGHRQPFTKVVIEKIEA